MVWHLLISSSSIVEVLSKIISSSSENDPITSWDSELDWLSVVGWLSVSLDDVLSYPRNYNIGQIIDLMIAFKEKCDK